jgi:hypothetical protein
MKRLLNELVLRWLAYKTYRNVNCVHFPYKFCLDTLRLRWEQDKSRGRMVEELLTKCKVRTK